MKTFLQHILSHTGILQAEDPGQHLFLFPNRRAGLHFKHLMARKANKPVWAPEVQSLNTWLEQQSEFRVADKLTLLFELYHVYRQIVPDHSEETFDRFYPWGQMMLHDFDECDRHLVNAEMLFTSVHNLREVEDRFRPVLSDYESFARFWEVFSNAPIDANRTQFATVWSRLWPVYKAFKEQLRQKGIAYEGMIMRELAEDKAWVEKLPFAHIWCCGFSALSKAEQQIFSHLKDSGKAEFLWDIDHWYFDNKNHEAGHFLREMIPGRFDAPDAPWLHDGIETIPKQIEVIDIPLRIGQAQVAGDMVQRWMAENGFNPEETAILLPDEQMLLPLLSALPEQLDSLNVTMGYPLQQSFTFSLLQHITGIHEGRKAGKMLRYPASRIRPLLSHPLFDVVEGQYAEQVRAKLNDALLFPTVDDLSGVPSATAIPDLIFSPCNSPDELLPRLRAILENISTALDSSIMPLEQEFLLHFHRLLQRLDDLVSAYGISLDFRMLGRLLRQMAASGSLSFSGEPLQGLQIMGMLETRCLDFKNVIVLGMNEGILPASASGHSYVPYAIRKAFGMPVAEQQEGVFAYHFYRLLHRVERVVLVYNSVVDPMSAGEPSRFIRQLKYELVPDRPHIHWNEQSPMVPFRTDGQHEINVPKSPEIMAELARFLEGGDAYLSPSSISNYIGCPLRFYFERIGRLIEQEESDEAMDAIRLGNIFHDTFENLYKKHEGQQVTREDIGKLKQQFPDVLKEMYRKHYDAHMAEAQGANVLNYTFLLRAGEELLDNDARQAPLDIVGVEKTWEGVVLDVPMGGRNIRVRVEGKFDRLDKVNGTARIIDYKSGTVDLKPARVAEPGPLFEKGEEKAAIQTLTYALMYLHQYPTEQVHVGVYPLRTIRKEGLVMLTENAPLDRETIRPFHEGLQSKLAELFNKDIPFSQTENVKLCEYCNFRDVCGR